MGWVCGLLQPGRAKPTALSAALLVFARLGRLQFADFAPSVSSFAKVREGLSEEIQ